MEEGKKTYRVYSVYDESSACIAIWITVVDLFRSRFIVYAV